jgi:hypothetical protein
LNTSLNPKHRFLSSPREQLLVLAGAFAASLIAILWSWKNAAFLLYGDAEAHTHIARRLFDSHRPGLTQLGSVWLPLPHLLLVPFVAVDSWWSSGFAAVIPSAAFYLLACLGLYRLARKWLSPASAGIGVAFFAVNPNLLYMQTTAMTEPLFLCELIWSVLLLVEWYASLDANTSSTTRLQWAVIAVLLAAVYTRYDGWILASLAWLAMAICLARRGRILRPGFILASIALLLGPVIWMAYNAVVFGDWLDFMRGPYSAQAIELRTSSSAVAPHPGWHNPWVSALYFEKAAEMDAVSLGWGHFLFLLTALATAAAWLLPPTSLPATHPARPRASFAWTLLLWLPLPFYAYSVSYGSVPIFLPVWTPFSWYNTRYGMELLPAFALFLGFATQAVLAFLRNRWPRQVWIAVAILFLALTANLAEMLHERPLTYIEGKKNAAARNYYNAVIPAALRQLSALHPGEILMDTSTYPSIIPHAGLTYRQTINESDKEFYWAALGAPAAHASIVVAFAGDDIDKAVKAHPDHLHVAATFKSPNKGWDQPDATVYVTDTQAAADRAQPSTTPASQ